MVNAGGEEEWVSKEIFEGTKSERIHENIESYKVGESEIWEIGSGNSVNLVCQISMTEFLDITFSYLIYLLNELEKTSLKYGKNELSIFDNKSFRPLFNTHYGELILN